MKRFISLLIVVCLVISFCIVIPVFAVSDKLYPAVLVLKDGEKWGYIDEKGTFVIKPDYDFASDFNEKGIAIVAKGKYSYDECTVWFIDRTGSIVSGPFKSIVPEYSNGVAILRSPVNGSKIIDKDGKILYESKDQLYEYADELIRFSSKSANGKELYGYMDISGKIIIPAKYQFAGSFKEGWAYVNIDENNNAIIDKKGNIVQTLTNIYNIAESRSEGLMGYYDEKNKKYGYKTYDGNIAIEAAFDSISGFRDGYADVAVNKQEYDPRHGLINKEGKFVIPAEYAGITYLGQGLYAVSEAVDGYFNDMFMPKAIFDNTGKQITGFKFYKLNEFNGKYASACDDTSTFFIDTKGDMVTGLPKLLGIGDITMTNGVIKAVIDGCLQYYTESGSLIWKKVETKPLDDKGIIKANKKRFRSDYCTYVEYPEISGLSNAAVQGKVNAKIKELFTSGFKSSKTEGTYTEDIYVGYNVEMNKDLLIVENSGYYYPIGAAHGMPTWEHYYFDLKTGTRYSLKDLFKSGSKYTTKLATLIRNQISLNLRISKIVDSYYYFDEKPDVAANQSFIIGKDSIKIYYAPYELTAYAAGFPEFEIPYGQINDILNTNGAFWKSFDKTMVNSKINNIGEVDSSVVTSVINVMKAYENGIVSAINNNSFTKVESTLLKGSSLYTAQKKLVQNLYTKGIKEKLVKYEVYAIVYDDSAKAYRVFTNETVAIKYPGKNYVNKQYSWCYTAVYDKSKNSCQLSDIKAW
jgi:KWG Leptospira./Protein of unknown function (DUF3298).